MSQRPDSGSQGKFLLIDQSLKGYHGHHLEYARSVVEAAVEVGWQGTIATHKSFPRSFSSNRYAFIRAFRTSWDDPLPWSPWSRVRSWAKENQHLWPASVWAGTTRYLRATAMVLSRRSQLLRRAIALVEQEFRNVWARVGRLSGWIGDRVRRLPFATLVTAILLAPLRLIWRWGLTAGVARHGRIFRQDLLQVIAQNGAGPGDLVFLHTLNLAELEEVLHLLSVARLETLPRFHILLRRDVSETYGQLPGSLGLERILNRFCASEIYPSHVRFYTDSDRLTADYDELSDIAFTTLPIPLRHDMIERNQRESRANGEPLNVVYLGDARPEKGYQYLPGLVSAIWPTHIRTQRARFTIQSNFNLPGGEPGIPEARRQLRQYPAHQVRILDELLTDGEYYAELGRADLVVIPYESDRYRARTSGVLAEALAAGKPVVVPEDTWMADELDGRVGLTFETTDELIAAVREILDDFDSFAESARELAPIYRAEHCAEALVARLGEQHDAMVRAPERITGAVEIAQRPSVLFFMQADAFVYRTGSFMVARNQLDHFQRAGYRVYAVLTVMDIMAVDYDEVKWTERVLDALDEFDLAAAWVLHFEHQPGNLANNLQVVASKLSRHASIGTDLRTYRGFGIPRDLKRFVESHPIDLVFINYVATLELVRRLGIRKGTPVVCEMVDIQAHQHAISNARETRSREFDKEIALLDECDSVVAINPIEMEAIRPLLSHASIFYAPKQPDVQPPRIGHLAGARELSEILVASESDLGIVNDSRSRFDGDVPQVERIRATNYFDLLFISTSHVPNVQSFKWFYDQVFIPHLADKGVTVLVAGTIYWDLLNEYRHPNLFFGGLLKNLDLVYAAAPIVILPIRAGAGTNIKTLEALSMCKPIVGTSMAFRGLTSDRVTYPTFDDPEAYAKQVLDLLADREERLALVEKGLGLLDPPARWKEFDAAMKAAFDHALGEITPPCRPKRVERAEAKLVEWSEEIWLFNRVMRDYVELGRCDPREIRPIRWAMQVEDRRAVFHELYQSFMLDRTAAVLKIKHIREPLEKRTRKVPSFDEFIEELDEMADDSGSPRRVFR
jgi:glycosyltransferase involved in cell wall biosynthesis